MRRRARTAAPRIRLEDGPTAIRPSLPDDLTELVALRVANREHTGPWEPVRDASFYTARRAAPRARPRRARLGVGQRLPVLRPRRRRRRPPHRARRPGQRRARGLAERHARLLDRRRVRRPRPRDAGGRPRAAVRLRARQPAPRPARGDPPQRPSLRVVERNGFRREGRAARYLRINGVWEDHDIFALTAEEWRRGNHG